MLAYDEYGNLREYAEHEDIQFAIIAKRNTDRKQQNKSLVFAKLKKTSVRIAIRVMEEVEVWNFGIHLFQIKLQNDYKIKALKRNLRCLWIRKLN